MRRMPLALRSEARMERRQTGSKCGGRPVRGRLLWAPEGRNASQWLADMVRAKLYGAKILPSNKRVAVSM